jgi:hypothetical protein
LLLTMQANELTAGCSGKGLRVNREWAALRLRFGSGMPDRRETMDYYCRWH